MWSRSAPLTRPRLRQFPVNRTFRPGLAVSGDKTDSDLRQCLPERPIIVPGCPQMRPAQRSATVLSCPPRVKRPARALLLAFQRTRATIAELREVRRQGEAASHIGRSRRRQNQPRHLRAGPWKAGTGKAGPWKAGTAGAWKAGARKVGGWKAGTWKAGT
jgi:hypothetical protein